MTDKKLLMLGAGAVVGLWLVSKVSETAADVVDAINPVSPNNLFYGGVNAVGGAISQDSSWSLGTWFHGLFNDSEFQPWMCDVRRQDGSVWRCDGNGNPTHLER